MMCHARSLILVLILAASAAAQDRGATQDRGYVIRSTTRLVEVNVIVQDKKGAAVTGLRRDDFEILEDGKPQRIAVFVAERATPAPLVASPPGVFTNRLPSQTGSRTGYSVILLDWLNGIWCERAVARQQVMRLLAQVEPHDLLTLCVLDRGLRILHDFTSDTNLLMRKLAAEKERGGIPQPDKPPDPMADASLGSFDLMLGDPAQRQARTFFATRRILETLGAFEEIARYLGGVPGRKSLIWVSSGFPSMLGSPADVNEFRSGEVRTFGPELDRVFRALNGGGISVYPVDARGLPYGTASFANTSTMIEFAARTGGRAYYNRNDLDRAVRSALDDSVVSYTLGYYPSSEELDGKFRAIRVKVRRAGVEVRHRGGYFADSDPRQDPKRANAELDRALAGPLDSTALPLSARVEFENELATVEGVLDALALSLRQEGGRWQGRVQLQAAFRSRDGARWTRVLADTLELNLREETYEKAKAKGIAFRQVLTIPPQSTALRLLARDAGSGEVGSLTIPIEVAPSGGAPRCSVLK